jgi:hypothetical protein
VNIWICNSAVADSGEHKSKRSDFKASLEKLDRNREVCRAVIAMRPTANYLYKNLGGLEMAVADIGWVTIAANESFEWFIHGWGSNDAVTYSIIVFPGTGPEVPFH